jgi:hypothetical protein
MKPMARREERLLGRYHVRAEMLRAHLAWAAKRFDDVVEAVRPHLDARSLELVARPPSARSATVSFRDLVTIDRALAAAVGGDPGPIYLAMGVHSARHHLKALPKHYDPELPHRFLESMSLVHRMFQNFGRSRYERHGRFSGRVRLEGYREYSPVFCTSGQGYYEEALRMMAVPGPIVVRETACRCAGEPACVFELSW